MRRLIVRFELHAGYLDLLVSLAGGLNIGLTDPARELLPDHFGQLFKSDTVGNPAISAQEGKSNGWRVPAQQPLGDAGGVDRGHNAVQGIGKVDFIRRFGRVDEENALLQPPDGVGHQFMGIFLGG